MLGSTTADKVPPGATPQKSGNTVFTQSREPDLLSFNVAKGDYRNPVDLFCQPRDLFDDSESLQRLFVNRQTETGEAFIQFNVSIPG